MPLLSRSLLLLVLSISSALAQTPPSPSSSIPLPTFDVVSIHENKSPTDNTRISWGNDAYVANNITLPELLMAAYNVRDELISGLPGWAESFHFDINAKISDPDITALKNLSREQHRAMILALLNDRFHLRAHIVVKTLPVYDLVIAKGGPKLKENTTLPSDAPSPGKPPAMKLGSMWISNSEMTAVGIPTSSLAATLAFRVERNVIDKTGLTGKYDINLKWTPAELQGKTDAATDNNAPDLFTALQEQLGLKLSPSKGPVDTLVIDHVELPTEN